MNDREDCLLHPFRWLGLLAAIWLGLPVPSWGAQDFMIAEPPAWVRARAAPAPREGQLELSRNGVQYLLSDVQTRVDGGQRQQYRHFAMQALNEKGVDSVAHIEIGFDPAYQNLTLHSITVRRGTQAMARLKASVVRVLQREKELEYRIYDGGKTANVFLEDVRAGDVVEYAYTVSGSNPVFGGRHFGQFDLQWGSPVRQLYARLLWPAGRPLQIKPINTEQQPRVQTRDGQTEYEWEMADRPGLQLESDTPGWYDPYPVVQWSEFGDWASVVRWALPLYRTPAELGPELRVAADKIGRAFAAPEDRLAEVLRLVQKEVRYLGVEVGAGSHAPSPPDLVMARRFGDCKDKTLLTISLLQALGIQARPALVHTQLRRSLAQRQPSPGLFNHVLVKASIAGRDYWLDPTRAPQLGELEMLSQANFEQALVLEEGTRGLQAMAAPESTLQQRKVKAVFDARGGIDAPVQLTVTTVLQGASAEAQRDALSSESREQTQKGYLNFYARYYPGVKALGMFGVQDDGSANRVTITERYEIADFWPHVAERKRREAQIEVPEVMAYLRAPQTALRQAPLWLKHPSLLIHSTEVLLPEDWSIKAETSKIEDPAFLLERSVALRTGVLHIDDRYESRADHVPAGGVAAYVANLDKAREALGYVLYKGDTQAPAPSTGQGWQQRLNWPVALLGLVFLGLALSAARRLYRDPPTGPTPPRSDGSPPRGLGIWLWILALVLLAQQVRGLVGLWRSLDAYALSGWTALTTPGGEQFHPWLAPLLLSELALMLWQLVASALLLALLLGRRRSLPPLFIVLQWTLLLAHALDIAACNQIPALAATAKDWAELMAGGIGTSAWTAYLLNSERVKTSLVEEWRAVQELPSLAVLPSGSAA